MNSWHPVNQQQIDAANCRFPITMIDGEICMFLSDENWDLLNQKIRLQSQPEPHTTDDLKAIYKLSKGN